MDNYESCKVKFLNLFPEVVVTDPSEKFSSEIRQRLFQMRLGGDADEGDEEFERVKKLAAEFLGSGSCELWVDYFLTVVRDFLVETTPRMQQEEFEYLNALIASSPVTNINTSYFLRRAILQMELGDLDDERVWEKVENDFAIISKKLEYTNRMEDSNIKSQIYNLQILIDHLRYFKKNVRGEPVFKVLSDLNLIIRDTHSQQYLPWSIILKECDDLISEFTIVTYPGRGDYEFINQLFVFFEALFNRCKIDYRLRRYTKFFKDYHDLKKFVNNEELWRIRDRYGDLERFIQTKMEELKVIKQELRYKQLRSIATMVPSYKNAKPGDQSKIDSGPEVLQRAFQYL